MQILALITVLSSGAIGGVLAGRSMPKISMGKVGNLIAGIIGGGIGGYFFDMIGMSGTGEPGAGATDLRNFLTTFVTGALSGGAIMLIIGFIIAKKNKKE